MTDFYKRMTEADHNLTKAIQEGEGSCRIAYLEYRVDECRKQAEAEEFEYLKAGETTTASAVYQDRLDSVVCKGDQEVYRESGATNREQELCRDMARYLSEMVV